MIWPFGWLGRRSFKLTDQSPFLGGNTYSKRLVTETTGLQLSAAWACVRRKSDTCGAFPLQVFRPRSDGTAAVDYEHPASYILQERPNPEFTSARLWTASVAALDLWGNAYLQKRYGYKNSVVALEWLYPSNCTPTRRDGRKIFEYVDPISRTKRDIPEEDVIHIRGFDLGGDKGVSAVQYGVQSLGSALDAEEAAGRLFSNGMKGGGWLVRKAGGTFTDPQREDLRKNIIDPMTGPAAFGKWGLLEADLDVKAAGFNPEEAQLLQTRRFDIETVCRWFDVPPILIGHAAEGQTMWGTGVEQIFLGWFALTLQPILTKIEKELQIALLSQADRAAGVFFRFNFDSLMRADSAARADYLTKMVLNGLMTRDEARAKLNLPKIPGGNVATVQSQMVPLEMIGRAPAAPQIGVPAQ